MTTIRVEWAVCATTADLPAGALLLALAAPRDPASFVSRVETADPAADYIEYPDVPRRRGHGHVAVPRLRSARRDAPCRRTGASALRDLGVQLVDADYTDPRPEHPEQPTGGAPFTPDDLLTLHEQLAADAWFRALTAGCGQP
jgi:hypothetical protein